MIYKEIAMFIIDKWHLNTLYKNLKYFEWIDKEVVKKYIEIADEDEVRELSKFKWILDKEIAMIMIDNWYLNILYLNILYRNLEYFEWIDKEVVKEYFKNREKSTARSVLKFKWILDKEIAMFLIDNWYLNTLYKNLKYFEWLDKEIAMFLIDNWYLDTLCENLEYFWWLDKEIAMFLIDSWHYKTLADNLEYFGNDLDDKIASKLIDKWYKSQVKKHKEKFKDLSIITRMRLWWK